MSNQFTHGYALLIGVDQSQADEWALPDVAKDIAALRDVLVHPQRCAYLADNVKVLTGTEATRNGILDGLSWLGERIEGDESDNATAVVYYTGHGWRKSPSDESDLYFLPYDIRAGQIEPRALRATDFAGAVDALSPRRLLVMLDCCHASGMGVKGEAASPTVGVGAAVPPLLLMQSAASSAGPGAKGMPSLAQGRGRAVLSSSTGEQKSYMRRDGKMSIFTYHLIEALTGRAQPQEGAKEVLVSDVMSHVHRRVPQSAQADWGEDQMPDYRISGNFPVALLLGGEGRSKGQPAPDPLEPLPEVTPSVSYHAEVRGSGAIAQGPGAVSAGAGGVAVGGNVGGTVITGDGNVIGDHSSSRVQKGGIRAGRIEAENVVDGAQIQGGTPDDAAQLIELAQAIQRGGITAGEIKAGSVVSGLQFLTGAPPKSPTDLQREVAALRRRVARAVADGEIASVGDAEDVTDALDKAEEELDKPEPSGKRVVRKLKTAAEILTGTAETAQAARNVGLEVIRLAPVAAALVQLAQTIF